MANLPNYYQTEPANGNSAAREMSMMGMCVRAHGRVRSGGGKKTVPIDALVTIRRNGLVRVAPQPCRCCRAPLHFELKYFWNDFDYFASHLAFFV